MSRTPRSILLLAAAGLVSLVVGVLAPAQAAAPRFPAQFSLPDGFQPEGIAIGGGPVAYFGSLVDGDIYRADLRTGRGSVISQGPGTPSVGMKLDGRGRLFVAGGVGGDARVVDTRTGRVLRSYSFAASTTFVNDVVLTRSFAWFTDSQRARLYGLPLGPEAGCRGPPTSSPCRCAATGSRRPASTPTASPGPPTSGRSVVIQSSTGFLFRVSQTTGVARRVDLGGRLLTAGDGLLTQGRTLYVVQNQLNRVAVIRVAGLTGRRVALLRSPGFDVPTTVARFGDWLYLPNARFATTPTPTTPYTVNRVTL